MPQPEIAIPVWPVATNTLRSPRSRAARVELERDRHLADRAVRSDAVMTRSDGSRLYGPVGRVEVGRPARRSISRRRAARRRAAARGRRSARCAARPRRRGRGTSPRPARRATPAACRRRGRRRSAGGWRPSSAASATVATIGTGRAQYGTTSSARRPALTESITATISRGRSGSRRGRSCR